MRRVQQRQISGGRAGRAGMPDKDGGSASGRPQGGPRAAARPGSRQENGDRTATRGRKDVDRMRGSKAVMIWARDGAVASDDAKRYVRMIDTGGGRDIVERCERVWPHYGEVIRNRKQYVAKLAMRYMSGGWRKQAVILGAGLDPLSVEIAARTCSNVAVYEIDLHGMGLKRRTIAKASPRAAGRIRQVKADLAGSPEQVARAMSKKGWRADRPSLVVAEGISYYLPESALRGLLDMFRTERGTGRIVLEYLRDAGSISADRAHIPDAVFGEFVRGTGIGGLARYSDAQAVDLVVGGNASIPRSAIMTVGPEIMEWYRTTGNRLFARDKSGWIAMCHGPI